MADDAAIGSTRRRRGLLARLTHLWALVRGRGATSDVLDAVRSTQPLGDEHMLAILDATPTGEGRPGVLRTDTGLVLKQQREPGKAHQEYVSTRLARLVLPSHLSVLPCWGVIGDEYLVAEWIDQPFDASDRDQVRTAVDYLVDLHGVDLHRADLGAGLRRSGFDSFAGAAMLRRLREDARIVRRSLSEHGQAGRAHRFTELADVACNRWTFDDDVVLGHGDFTVPNLRRADGRLVPVDWVDFGLCDRAYEVMQFVTGLPAEVGSEALAQYSAATACDVDELRARGRAAGTIIVAGSLVRSLRLEGRDAEPAVARLDMLTDRLAGALAER